MTLQWTLIAVCMYAELVFTIILLLPLISAKRWHSFFKSRFLASIVSLSGIYFKIFLAILVVCFLDAIREMNKYGDEVKQHAHGGEHAHLDVNMQQHMRLFRAQRNFYISGFALVLCIVIHRLTNLISTLAVSQAETEAAIKQAKSASETAQQLMSQSGDETQADSALKKELEALQEENRKLKIENEAALSQAKSVSAEYDRVLRECEKLQAQGDKKDD